MPTTIRNWEDLKEFGIIHLTGEADPLRRRALVDLTEQGETIVKDLLSLPYDFSLARNHNSGAVSSISLPYEIFTDLAIVALASVDAETILVSPDGVTGIMGDNDVSRKDVDQYIKYHGRDKVTIVKRPQAV